MKRGRIFAIVIAFGILLLGFWFFTCIKGLPWLHSRAIKDAEQYAKDNFPFKVVCVRSSFYFEDQAYVVDCYAEKAPDISFEIVWDPNPSNMKDSYFLSVWEQELQKRYKQPFSDIAIHLDYFRDFSSYQQHNYSVPIPSVLDGLFSPGLSLTLRIESNDKKQIDNDLRMLLDQIYWDFKNSDLQVELNSHLYLVEKLPQLLGK